MSIIDEIKQKLDIVEVVGQYVTLVKSGRTFRSPCPFHSEKKPSFFVYPDQQTWHCFGACNTGGDIFSFVMKKEGLSFGETLRLLAEKTGVEIPSRAKSDAADRARERLFQTNQAAVQYYQNLLLNSPGAEKARRYLADRGLNDKSISDFQLGYSSPGWESLKGYLTERGYGEQELISAGLLVQNDAKGESHDRFRDHIMFPIMDDRGRTAGFGARVLDDSSPKYINSPQTIVFDKSSNLYGIHLAKSAIRQQDLAVFVEGYMDVIVAHQYGFHNVIAPMGVAITERQISLVKKLTRVFVMALDPDEAGEIAMVRVGETLTSPSDEAVTVRRKINPAIPTPSLNEKDINRFNIEGKRINTDVINTEMRVAILPDGKDPDEIIRSDAQKWSELVKSAVPIMSFIFDTTASKYDLSKVENRSLLIEKMLPLLLDLTDYSQQNYYLTRLAEITKTEYRKLELALSRAKPVNKLKRTGQADLRQAVKYIRSSPVEEYALALLLHHPELKAPRGDGLGLVAEYFENSENRIIFENWIKADEPLTLKESLDPEVWEYFDSLITRGIPENQIEEKYLDCILRLRERYLRKLQEKQAEILSLEAEAGDIGSVLTKLEEQGTIINEELTKIFNLRAKPQ